MSDNTQDLPDRDIIVEFGTILTGAEHLTPTGMVATALELALSVATYLGADRDLLLRAFAARAEVMFAAADRLQAEEASHV